ncbi:MAG: glycosyltransferase 61 family protein [Desulfobacterales bacterium]
MIHFSRMNPKIRHIEKPKDKSQDIITRLKATWLGKFYTSHLKLYPFIRRITIWLWRNLFPVYLNFRANITIYLLDRMATRWRVLIRLSEFAERRDIASTKLVDAAVVETPAPKVYPGSDQSYLRSPHERYRFPEVFVAKVSNGMICGGTNLILAEGKVICHDLYDFEHDYTSEELHGRTLIDPKAKRIRWLLHDKAPERISAAASFVDACAPNYAHWLTEVLPRIAVFCAEQKFRKIPILVNDELHKNIMESLLLVAGIERTIITLPIGRALFVDELYITSAGGYVPFERRTNKLSEHSHGIFSPRALEVLRNNMNALGMKPGGHGWPEKIFLRRNSANRKVTNVTELEKLVASRGYAIVQPEKLTFLQQIRLFSNAKYIVGASGAALANILFAPKDAKIVILMNKNRNTSYWYWQNMACASGNTVSYVFGKADGTNTRGIHADFLVDTDNLISAIEEETRWI